MLGGAETRPFGQLPPDWKPSLGVTAVEQPAAASPQEKGGSQPLVTLDTQAEIAALQKTIGKL